VFKILPVPPIRPIMNVFTQKQPEPERYSFDLSPHWTATVLSSGRGAIVGLFLDGELMFVIDRALGQA
jgi:hypothetical protein